MDHFRAWRAVPRYGIGSPEPPPIETVMNTPAPEVIVVEKRRIACDGGGALGHPRVYLEMGQGTEVECPYCDRKFVLSRAAAEADHH
jgi:uncharacterized Zn-finger protein